MQMRRAGKKCDKWEIQRERMRLDGSEPLKGVRDSQPVSDMVSSLMKKLGIQDQHWLRSLEDDWASIVGDAVARHTRPGIMNERSLTVFVDSSVWISELERYGKEKMYQNLQQRFGQNRIKTIRFQLDPDS